MRLAQLFLAAATLGGLGCFAPERPATTGRVEQYALPATTVDETYQLFVRLPPDYDAEPDRTFPLVVQLDANLPAFMEFEVTAGFASVLEQRGEIPPSIVVGIGYGTADEARVERFRDLGLPMENAEFRQTWSQVVPDGEAPRFLDFLRGELVPELARRYRIAGPQGRALLGHSLGGLFVLYALTQHAAAAPLFTGYVAASPSLFWDGGQMLSRWRQLENPPQPLVLFAAAGQLEGPEMVVYFDDWVGRVRAAQLANLDFESRKFQTDHVGSAAPSFRDGLRHLFAHGLRVEP